MCICLDTFLLLRRCGHVLDLKRACQGAASWLDCMERVVADEGQSLEKLAMVFWGI